MVFWRGEAYTALFDHLDRHGGFYYEVTSLIPTPSGEPRANCDHI